ncbi:MAG: beta-lactamase family protein [Chthoniobacterales bacterium]|nr:beta-lactamase family protein [Chthoniobacterales bacterium]
MSVLRFLFLLLVGIITLSAPAQAASPQENFQDFLNQWRKKQSITSVVVTIEDLHTKKITTYASGLTRHGAKPVTAQTLYGVGSITKTFVAAALLQLQEEGKIKLDDPIGSYFPEYPRWHAITIRQLLNMTSGIANTNFSKERDDYETTVLSSKKIIEEIYKQPDLFPPGTKWLYSNTNYFLLGWLIEKVSGASLNELFTKRFFQPLHLTHTFYSDSFYSKNVIDQMAHAYAGKQDITAFNASHYGPTGSMLMNSQDLLTWAQALLTPGIILSKKSLQEMETTIAVPPTPPKPEGCRYGLGIYSLQLSGMPSKKPIWYYAGVIRGYTSCFIFIPSQQRLIVAQVANWPGEHFEVLFPNQPLMKRLLK